MWTQGSTLRAVEGKKRQNELKFEFLATFQSFTKIIRKLNTEFVVRVLMFRLSSLFDDMEVVEASKINHGQQNLEKDNWCAKPTDVEQKLTFSINLKNKIKENGTKNSIFANILKIRFLATFGRFRKCVNYFFQSWSTFSD